MTTIILYSLCVVLLLISFLKDKSKTKKAVLDGIKSLESIMPQFLTIIFIVGIMLSIVDKLLFIFKCKSYKSFIF